MKGKKTDVKSESECLHTVCSLVIDMTKNAPDVNSKWCKQYMENISDVFKKCKDEKIWDDSIIDRQIYNNCVGIKGS